MHSNAAMSEENITVIKNYAEKNPPLYAPFQNAAADCTDPLYKDNSQPPVLLYGADDGLLLFDGWHYSFSAQNEDAAERLLSTIDKPRCIVSHEARWEEAIYRHFPQFRGHSLPCEQACYLGEKTLPVPDVGVEIRPLTMEHLDCVAEHYERGSRQYDAKAIENGLMLGAFRNGILTGFIGVHGEGSMGMLEVLPEYRRQGIASALEIAMTNYMLSRSRVPFGHVVVGNSASSALQRSLGYSVANDLVTWHSAHH